MFSKTHQGIVKKTVVLEFENGYIITLNAGVEMSMHLVMDEAQIKAAEQKMRPTKKRAGSKSKHLSTPPFLAGNLSR